MPYVSACDNCQKIGTEKQPYRWYEVRVRETESSAEQPVYRVVTLCSAHCLKQFSAKER